MLHNHKGVGPKEMAKKLNELFNTDFSYEQIRYYYKNHKLTSGIDTRYKKGRKCINGFKKGERVSVPTEFKRGHRPHNYLPVGTERTNGDGYIEVKYADGKNCWRGKHVLLWEEHYGPLEKGNAVIFGDGDKRNFEINNLIKVTRRQLLELNRRNLIQKDSELTKTGVLIADINIKICEMKKKK
ncbi:HNH endonuclease [Acidaminobacter sp. JC074]|nr:HNH endonuclease [Acidaminobacter sp. JC074]